MIKCLKLRVATTQFPISSLVLKLYESNPTRIINLVKWEVLGIPKRSWTRGNSVKSILTRRNVQRSSSLVSFFFSTGENQKDIIIRSQSVSIVETRWNHGRCAPYFPKRPWQTDVWEWRAVTRAPGKPTEKVKLAICIPTHLFHSESTFHPSYWTLAIEFPRPAIWFLNLSPPWLLYCSAQRFILLRSQPARVPIPWVLMAGQLMKNTSTKGSTRPTEHLQLEKNGPVSYLVF